MQTSFGTKEVELCGDTSKTVEKSLKDSNLPSFRALERGRIIFSIRPAAVGFNRVNDYSATGSVLVCPDGVVVSDDPRV